MMYYGAQYYRPPFPGKDCWQRDMENMRRLGFTCVKLWAVWNWVERTPGEFHFEDLDELVALAKKVVSWNSLTKVQEFVEIFQEYVKTDLSTTDMLYFASQAVGVDLDTGITQGTLEGRGEGVVRGYKYCFVFQAEDILPTLNELVNPYDQPLTEEDLDLPQAEYYWNGTVID